MVSILDSLEVTHSDLEIKVVLPPILENRMEEKRNPHESEIVVYRD